MIEFGWTETRKGEMNTRFYAVKTDDGLYRCNQRHLRQIPGLSGNDVVTHKSTTANLDNDVLIQTRSGRISRPPAQYEFD